MEGNLARARGLQRGHKSVYEKSRYTGVTHEIISNGTMHEKTTQVNPLVEVGHYAIIENLIIYDNPVPVIKNHVPNDCVTVNKGKKTRTIYKPARDCCDVFGKPFIFKVKEYAKGMENALDPSNFVILEGVYSSGITFEKQIRTLYLASGSSRMFEVYLNEVINYET